LLAIGGIAPNAIVLVVAREFGREMAFPHLILWPPPNVVIIWLMTNEPEPAFARYLWLLLMVDGVCIAFDFQDVRVWRRTRIGQEKPGRGRPGF